MEYRVRHLRFVDYQAGPWKNGRGSTFEVAASTAAVGAQTTPSWHISMATIDEEAPFSCFPGLVRTLGVVEGAGVELTVDGRTQVVRVGENSGPFAGNAPASARPLEGSALDLNLMIDPSRILGRMVAIGTGSHELVGLMMFVVSLADGLELRLNDGETLVLPRLDTAVLNLRARPIARLTLSLPDAASSTVVAVPDAASSTGPAHPIAYLLTISR